MSNSLVIGTVLSVENRATGYQEGIYKALVSIHGNEPDRERCYITWPHQNGGARWNGWYIAAIGEWHWGDVDMMSNTPVGTLLCKGWPVLAQGAEDWLSSTRWIDRLLLKFNTGLPVLTQRQIKERS